MAENIVNSQERLVFNFPPSFNKAENNTLNIQRTRFLRQIGYSTIPAK